MKVLHVISSGGMYGAEAVILNLSRTLNEGGHGSVLGIFNNSAEPNLQFYEAAQKDGIEAHLISCQGQIDRSVPRSIAHLAREVQADVIHAHGYKADVYVYLARRTLRIPMVSTCHTWYDNDLFVRVYGAIDRWVLKSYAAVVAVSEDVKARLVKSGVDESKVRLIQNGIDLRPFVTMRADDDQVERGLPLRVGLVGRLSPEKGVDLFIRAAAQVLLDIPSARFEIVGDGPLHAELQLLIEELKLTSNVFLLGRCIDMAGFYQSLDLLVSSSRHEGLPIALLEGMASGLPLVATAVGAVPSLVLDGETGRLVPANDVSELAKNILELLDTSELRRQYGEAARKRIETGFSAERMTSEYLNVYQHVVSILPA